MASIFLALRNPEKLKTRFPGSLRLRRPPVELRAETNFTRTSVLPSTEYVPAIYRTYCTSPMLHVFPFLKVRLFS